MQFAPNSPSHILYDACSVRSCSLVRDAVMFVLGNQTETALLHFFSTSSKLKPDGKPGGFSMLSKVAKGQSHAHDIVRWEIIRVFFESSPEQCPFRPGSNSSNEDKRRFARTLLTTNDTKHHQHITRLGLMSVDLREEKHVSPHATSQMMFALPKI